MTLDPQVPSNKPETIKPENEVFTLNRKIFLSAGLAAAATFFLKPRGPDEYQAFRLIEMDYKECRQCIRFAIKNLGVKGKLDEYNLREANEMLARAAKCLEGIRESSEEYLATLPNDYQLVSEMPESQTVPQTNVLPKEDDSLLGIKQRFKFMAIHNDFAKMRAQTTTATPLEIIRPFLVTRLSGCLNEAKGNCEPNPKCILKLNEALADVYKVALELKVSTEASQRVATQP